VQLAQARGEKVRVALACACCGPAISGGSGRSPNAPSRCAHAAKGHSCLAGALATKGEVVVLVVE
jgi:hypothetical protein